MIVSAADEERYWSSLEGDEVLNNTAGVPPYDAWEVGSRLFTAFGDYHDFVLGADVRVLDLGCGTGRLTNIMAQRLTGPYSNIHGVDISAPLIKLAVAEANYRHLDNVHYWHGNGRTLPPGLGGRKYDLVYSITMFQHIPHDAKWSYIHQVANRLKPGGVFVFTIALGDVDEFQNHQIAYAECQDFGVALKRLFGSCYFDETDERGWSWITCRKATS